MTRRSRPREIVLVGRGSLARETARDLSKRATVLGAFSLRRAAVAPDPNLRHLGRSDRLGAYLALNPVDEVYMAADVRTHHAELQAAVDVCERMGIPFAVPAHVFRMGRALPRGLAGVADGYVHYSSLVSNPFQDFCKRAADIALSLAALVALSPLLAGVAAAVALSSPGPVLFRQVRVGLRGRPFTMFKFRTMVADAEQRLAAIENRNEQSGPVFKIANDPRITRIGRVLRTYSLDELPQIANVLLGHMSLVGPRPPLPREVAQYLPWQRRRLSVRPGLTCLWQVNGRNRIGFDEWMMLDLQYVDQWSLGQDAALVGRTVPVVVTGRGAS